MSLFEYVIVLVSVVLSLGLAKALESHAGLLQLGKRVRWSPTYVAWLLIIVLWHIDIWASLWVLREATTWQWSTISGALLAAMSLFYASVLSSPRVEGDAAVDLWDFHMENRRRYVGALLGYALLGAYLNWSVMRDHFAMANVTALLPGITLLLTAIFVPNRWVQRAAPVLLLVLLAIYFAQYLPQIHG